MSLGKLSNASAASVTTGAATFDLHLLAGAELDLLIDGPPVVISPTYSPIYGGNLVSVKIKAADYASFAAATAAELVAVLNRELAAQAAAGQPPAAVASGTSTVSIKSVKLGQNATLQILPSSTPALLTALTLTAGLYLGAGLLGVGAQVSPIFHDVMSFAGDSSYPTGGSLGFGAAVKSFFGDGRQVIAVLALDCNGYMIAYVPATDALKVFDGADTTPDEPLDEVDNGTNLSGTTFNVLVISA
jgi:hypothetical protein